MVEQRGSANFIDVESGGGPADRTTEIIYLN